MKISAAVLALFVIAVPTSVRGDDFKDLCSKVCAMKLVEGECSFNDVERKQHKANYEALEDAHKMCHCKLDPVKPCKCKEIKKPVCGKLNGKKQTLSGNPRWRSANRSRTT